MNLNPGNVIKRPRFMMDVRRPGYDIDFHPRAFSKPLSCQVGKHPWPLQKIIGPGGIPHLYCRKCGQAIAEGLYTGTWSKDDISRLSRLKQNRYLPTEPRTKEEIMKEIWEKHQESESKRRERMSASIERFVKERMLGQ